MEKEKKGKEMIIIEIKMKKPKNGYLNMLMVK
jgi:hypothetical protein